MIANHETVISADQHEHTLEEVRHRPRRLAIPAV
jgi:hypothetical protein